MSPFAVIPRRGFGVVLVSCLLFSAPALLAQPGRIPRPVDNLRTVPLKGNRTPRAHPQDDQGRVDPLGRIGGMRLRLKPSPSQAAEIERLLAGQQDPASPDYRNWLTPEEYADRFGLTRTISPPSCRGCKRKGSAWTTWQEPATGSASAARPARWRRRFTRRFTATRLVERRTTPMPPILSFRRIWNRWCRSCAAWTTTASSRWRAKSGRSP